MKISIGVCTWNRCDLLGGGLDAMTRLALPRDVDWELLVVNNNSTDATDEVLRSFSGRLPLRILFEAAPGKSHALNRAVREATGDYIVWTDDDTRVDAEWLAAYCRAFNRWPDATVFGGRIDPWFEGSPPDWLRLVIDRISTVYGVSNYGPEPLPLSDEVIPFGANMAVRRDVQLKYSYDPTFGPRPGVPMRGEETTLVRQMLLDGHTGWWIPDATVQHLIPVSLQQVRYLRQYFFGAGLHEGLQLPMNGTPEVFGRPRYLWRRAIESEGQYYFHRFLTKRGRWVQDLALAADAWGQMSSYGARRRASR